MSEKLKNRLEEVRENLFKRLFMLNFKDIFLSLSLDVSNLMMLQLKTKIVLHREHEYVSVSCTARLLGSLVPKYLDVLCVG